MKSGAIKSDESNAVERATKGEKPNMAERQPMSLRNLEVKSAEPEVARNLNKVSGATVQEKPVETERRAGQAEETISREREPRAMRNLYPESEIVGGESEEKKG
jgi:hypothetical protein